MRRLGWLLGLFAIVVVGVVWWTSRNATRMEPLDAQRFAQMRETEQVEWLIEQILARSKRTDWFTQIVNLLTPASVYRAPLLFAHVDAIGTACVEYEMPHLLSRCALYLDREFSHPDHLFVYQALIQARKGNWQAAEQTLQRIQQDEFRALAWTHLGCLQAQMGRTESAQQSFDQALSLIRQSVFLDHYERYLLRLIFRYYPAEQRDELLQRLATQIDAYPESIVVAEVYRAQGKVSQLRAMLERSPRATERLVLRTKFLQALIEQGQVEEAMREIVRRGAMSDTVAVQLLASLHRRGYRDDLQRFTSALEKALLERQLLTNLPPPNHFETVQVATRYGQIKIQIKDPYQVLDVLSMVYIKDGSNGQVERLLEALLPEDRLTYRFRLVSICHAVGQSECARQQLERALSETPRVAGTDTFAKHSYLMLSACAYARLGDYSRALELAQVVPPEKQRGVLDAILANLLEARNPSEERRIFWGEVVEIVR